MHLLIPTKLSAGNAGHSMDLYFPDTCYLPHHIWIERSGVSKVTITTNNDNSRENAADNGYFVALINTRNENLHACIDITLFVTFRSKLV